MHLFELIKCDLERLTPNANFKGFVRWYFLPQGSTFPHDVWFRILQNCKKSKIKKYTIGILAYLIERRLSIAYGIHANSNMEVGSGLCIVHCDGIYLNCKRIGKNFTVYQNVTLGSARGIDNDNKSEIPVVEDNVTIYPGAIITGNVVLHNGCVVGANSFVNKDVPENVVVAGAPAKIIKDKR